MQHAHHTAGNFTNRGRDSTGIAITIALHLGVAALALIGFNVVNAPPHTFKPVITDAIPDPVTAPQTQAEPVTTEQPVRIDNLEPIITIDQPIPHDPIQIAPYDPPIAGSLGAETGPVATQSLPPVGASRTARFDPRYAAQAQPPYPPQATRLEQEGVVIVHVRIGRDGRVLDASLAQSSGSSWLDKAALAQALAKWRFIPALKDGETVETSRDISIRFELKRP